MVSNGIQWYQEQGLYILSTSQLNNQPPSGNRSDSGTCKIETRPFISVSVVYNISYLTGKSFGWIRYGPNPSQSIKWYISVQQQVS